jgi:hypothetical protein
MMKRTFLLVILLISGLSACEAPAWGRLPTNPQVAMPTPPPEMLPSATVKSAPSAIKATQPPAESAAAASTPAPPTPTLAPEAWKSMPVVPQVSERMVEIYRAGLAAGHDPTHFSKIGDCQNITTYFLADFDHPNNYRLGPTYAALQPTIDHFAGSWSRESLAVKGGLNVAAAMNPFWANPKQCKPNETPLACELRVYNPGIVTISMEESWSGDIGKYDSYLRKIVEYVLSQNVVPILATRAEPEKSTLSINATVARIAYDYQVPLWNFWAAAYPLPSHGLTADGFHLTQARYFFDDPARMQAGWPWRNLTALQVIDAVYRSVSGQP